MVWPVNTRTSAMMDEAQTLYGATITATQGSPNVVDGPSAGTHDGEGVIDVVGTDLDAIVVAMRKVGFAAWHRTRAEGFTPHVHGVALGEPGLSPAAADQVTDYLEGRNGLATNAPDDGPRDWVGITWEDYLAGNPPSGGTRPFHGAQIGLFDIVVTAGSLDPYADIYSGLDVRDDAATVTLNPGDEFYAYMAGATTADTDIYSMANWRLNASGHGTLALAESFDAGYSYNPPFTWTALGDLTVDRDDLALTATPGTSATLNPVNVRGQAGALLLRVTCVTGTVTLDWLVLQVEPPSGLYVIDADGGYWTDYQTPAIIWESPLYKRQGTLTRSVEELWTDGEAGQPDDVNTRMDDALVETIAETETESWSTPPFGFLVEHRVIGESWWHKPNVLIPSFDHRITVEAARIIMTATLDTFPDRREMPNFMTTKIRDVDYTTKPGGSGSLSDPLRFGDFEAGDTESVGWEPMSMHPFIQNYQPDIIGPTLRFKVVGAVSVPGAIAIGGTDDYDFSDATPYVDQGDGVEEADGGVFILTPPVSDFTVHITSSFEASTGFPPPVSTWDLADGIIAQHGYAANVSTNSPVLIRLQMPDYRYWVPGWVRSPDALDNTDPEGAITWLRQRQRNDGLGNSITRARGASSRQVSLRQRGYR